MRDWTPKPQPPAPPLPLDRIMDGLDTYREPTGASEVAEARGWLLDCGCDPDELASHDDASVIKTVAANYDGGWAQFIADGQPT